MAPLLQPCDVFFAAHCLLSVGASVGLSACVFTVGCRKCGLSASDGERFTLLWKARLYALCRLFLAFVCGGSYVRKEVSASTLVWAYLDIFGIWFLRIIDRDPFLACLL